MEMIQVTLMNASASLNSISPEEGAELPMYHRLQENWSVLMERYSNLMAAFDLEGSKRKSNRLSRRKGAASKASVP
jgi:hypothetical protein